MISQEKKKLLETITTEWRLFQNSKLSLGLCVCEYVCVTCVCVVANGCMPLCALRLAGSRFSWEGSSMPHNPCEDHKMDVIASYRHKDPASSSGRHTCKSCLSQQRESSILVYKHGQVRCLCVGFRARCICAISSRFYSGFSQ